MMKRTQLYFISMAILSLLYISCADKQTKAGKELLGKWQFAKVGADVAASDDAIREKIITSLLGNAEVMTGMNGKFSLIEFRENGVVDNDGKLGTYFVDGNKLSFKGEKDSDFVDFRIIEDTLVFSYNFPENLTKLMRSTLQIPDNVKVYKCGVNIFFVKK